LQTPAIFWDNLSFIGRINPSVVNHCFETAFLSTVFFLIVYWEVVRKQLVPKKFADFTLNGGDLEGFLGISNESHGSYSMV